jgi:hypothetical protein
VTESSHKPSGRSGASSEPGLTTRVAGE